MLVFCILSIALFKLILCKAIDAFALCSKMQKHAHFKYNHCL